MKVNIRKKDRNAVNGGRKGFTTLELIMVVVMAGIMMTIVLPRIGMVTSMDLYSTARQVKSDIRYTQELAMGRYRKSTITFSPDSDTYSITASGYSESKELPKRSKAVFDSGNSTSLVYTFGSSGEPDSVNGAGDTLRISSGGSYKEVVVESVTGRATIQ